MNRYFTLIISMLLAFASHTYADGTSSNNEGMTLSAQEWTRNVVMGWNLGNSLESAGNETAWGNPKTTQEMIKKVHEAGFNAIRIPIRWGDHLTNSTTMTINADWLARVKEIVDWCLAEDMYVVINDHHEEWYDRNPTYAKQEANNKKLSALWTNIANAFKDYGEKLAFAGTNETTINWANPTKENQDVQNSYNQTFVNAVRATGGKNLYRVLVVQTYACSPYHGLNGFTIPTDKVEGRLCVEYHYYDPYGYGLLTGNANSDYYYWGKAYEDKAKAKGKSIPSDNETTQANLFDRINNTWGKKGLGIVMGEYGVTNHYTSDDKQTQQENMQYYLKTTVANARKRGFAAFVWDNNVFSNGNEAFGIFRRSQNMAVGNEYFLKGICEGAGTEYKEPEHHEDIDVPTDGNVYWEGDAMMDWGDGLQVTIPASEFSAIGKDVKLLLYYTLDFTDYNMIQFFYGDWSSNPSFIIDGQTITKEYVPSDIHGIANGEDGVSVITFSEDVYNLIAQKGLAVQGHGVRLKMIVLTATTGIKTITMDAANKDAIYNLQGKRITKPQHGIYILNGKKYIAK